MAFKIKNGDTRPVYIVGLLDKVGTPEEGPLDLTNVKAVRFKMRKHGAKGAPKISGAAEIEDAAAGVVAYVWAVGDTSETGEFDAEFELEYNDGGKETVPNEGYFSIIVTDDLDD